MPSVNFARLVSEYRTYSSRDLPDRHLSELVDLLDQLFPSLYKADMSDPPEYVVYLSTRFLESILILHL
jgi:hypothetical protein